MNSEFEALFGNFLKNPGADEASTLATYHSLGLTPPDEYLAALQLTDGGEGFIGPSYFHLYATSEIVELNEAYQVNEFAPGLIVFGSSGGGEAYAFDAREAVIEIVKIPFIPMDFEFAERLGASFLRFLYALRDADNEGNSTPQIRMSAVGKEVHEIKPIIFGGSGTDPQNKTLLPARDHAKFVVWWNRLYRDLRRKRPVPNQET